MLQVILEENDLALVRWDTPPFTGIYLPNILHFTIFYWSVGCKWLCTGWFTWLANSLFISFNIMNLFKYPHTSYYDDLQKTDFLCPPSSQKYNINSGINEWLTNVSKIVHGPPLQYRNLPCNTYQNTLKINVPLLPIYYDCM